MFNGARKEDLRLVASEINEEITDQMKITDLKELIEKSDQYKKDPDFVKNLLETVISDRKLEVQRNVEVEKIKLERIKAEIELAQIRAESTKKEACENTNVQESIEQLIKSVRTLTVRIPSKPEAWGQFFSSLERAYSLKNVPEKYKAEILLNLLGEKAANIIVYVTDEEIHNYEKIKNIVLREFEPSPQICLENFRKAYRSNESHIQFASRMTTDFDYYLKLRKVSDFETLKQLIVSDKIFQTLDRDTASHVTVREANNWFKPIELGKECDLYFASRGKSVIENSDNSRKYRDNSNVKYMKNVSKVFLSDVKNSKCMLCKTEVHPLYKCPSFKKISVSERVEVVRKNNLCFNCLASNHSVRACKSKYSCGMCNGRHHMTLHFTREKNSADVNIKTNETPVNASDVSQAGERNEGMNHFASPFVPQKQKINDEYSIAATSYNINKTKNVLLSTATCLVKDKYGHFHELRALLDNGSMANFLSKNCADRLNLTNQKVNMVVSCINNASMTIKGSTNATIANKSRDFERELNFLIVPKITDLTPCKVLNVYLQGSEFVKFADDNFNVPSDVDILLGAEIFFELLRPGQIYPQNSNLILQNTIFGYVVNGSVYEENETKVHCGLVRDGDLNKIMSQFWELEDVEGDLTKNKESKICDEHYTQTHMRDHDGRYIVSMPLKEDPTCLGNSKDIALRKLNSSWNRLVKDQEYLSLYIDFLREYKDLGHMTEVEDTEEREGTYFIPHLGVYRPHKNTTKLRVVFNASSPTTKGNSLNSLQYNGGVIQEDLFSIMVKFRENGVAFIADIRQMYRQIWIHPDQRKLQRILWKEDVDEPVKVYELATVTYGTVSAPYLAMRTLQQLSIDEGQNFPLAAPVLINNFFMDDVLVGAPTLSEAKELQRQLIGILDAGGMKLHKWRGSSPELSPYPEKQYKFSKTEDIKALGVSWKSTIDCFSFEVKMDLNTSPTKRSVLSTIARLFDPLGLLGPIVAKAKILMQRLWLLQIDWSEKLPAKEAQEWQQFVSSLQTVNNINIERCIVMNNAVVIELHGFADSSERAYGAVIYCKSCNTTGDVTVRLIASKSRVAPLKQTTIPRLELCAAVLLAKLMKKVQLALTLKVSEVYYWSDSTIVLWWITKDSLDLKTFVANRVATIQELTPIPQWRHVSSEQNPADLISRGLDPEKLLHNNLWWQGPKFLTESDYPDHRISVLEQKGDPTLELKNSNCFLTLLNMFNSEFVHDLINLSNKYSKIIRIVSFIYRFIQNCRNKVSRRVGHLGTDELIKAETFILKQVQQEEFGREVSSLTKKGEVSKESQLRTLHPFIDSEGLLRVGGRLDNSNLSVNRKFPILLPSKHKVTRLILDYYHQKYLHLGAQALLFQVRQKFWILNGRARCRKVVHECIICFKVKPIVCEQLMGSLLKERVTQNFPFNCSGVDFAGPFFIKYKNQRKGIYHKVYVSIFVCFVTKSVHLELVTELTSQAFIATLKRFFARRGKCSKLYSDNAKNFVGGNLELRRLHGMVKNPDEVLSGYLADEGIDWKFLPPRAPNFGGLWEAGVKSFKYHLKRVVGNSKLNYEEFLTLITQIEGILNSRPLVPLTADIDDLSALTPGHFLIGRPINSIVEPNLTNMPENRLKLWQRISKMVQVVWKKWSNDYLSNLQQRTKWFFEKNNVKIGDLVIVKEDNMAVCNWPLGRIMQIFPGKDNKIRVVTVKTQRGLFKRPISKICVVPMEK